jgi:hypothetical protein
MTLTVNGQTATPGWGQFRARFYFEIELDHRDQLPVIADDLTDRYGMAEAVWYEVVGPSEEGT